MKTTKMLLLIMLALLLFVSACNTLPVDIGYDYARQEAQSE